ncbi:NEDD8 ligase DCN1, partial [Ascoidea rubescens DSM 1968]
DPDNREQIGLDGTINYIQGLGLEPEDRRALILAFILDSPSMGIFRHESFVSYWTSQNAYTLPDMRGLLDRFEDELKSETGYIKLKQLYRYSFGFIIEKNQTTIDSDIAIDYWELLLEDRFPEKIPIWCEFVKLAKKGGISKDVWNMFLDFLIQYKDDNTYDNWDPMAAWPNIIDEFVSYCRKDTI